MPSTLLDSGSEFDTHRILLGRWLRDNLASVRSVTDEVFACYRSDQKFVAGWEIEIEQDVGRYCFYVLVDAQFPYSPIRIGLPSDEQYLTWPHVEPGGLLCLPRLPPPTTGLTDAIETSLRDAIELVARCQDPAYIDREVRREFISYWNRSSDAKAVDLFSLLDATNRTPRHISVWRGAGYALVGEEPDQLRSWLNNMGGADEPEITRGVFAYLEQAPVLPFPDHPPAVCALLERWCPGALTLLQDLPIDKSVTIVLAADSPSGTGLFGVNLSPPNLAGFRRGHTQRPGAKMILWKTRSNVQRRKISRFDAAWIHGRGMNKELPALAAATVVVLGCGSLGSQLAMRLAQAGIGGLHLVDPETLVAANVGRHALGVSSVGQNKAAALADMLRTYYPHMHTVQAWNEAWQSVYQKRTSLLSGSSLIVACLGTWSEDGPLGELQAGRNIRIPIIYGWLDEFGSAAHALALGPGLPSLTCVLSPTGELRIPETTWTGDGLLQAEPACGSLFQPYGPLEVGHAETLVTRLCIDVLTGSTTLPTHRIYAGPTSTLHAAGGEWTREHLKHRPPAYDGSFEYVRAVEPCGICSACNEVP